LSGKTPRTFNICLPDVTRIKSSFADLPPLYLDTVSDQALEVARVSELSW